MSSVLAGGTRENILRRALALFEERGYYAVAMEDIARAAGVSRQAVYLHFGSRGALVMALADHLDSQGLGEATARVRAAPTAVEALEAAVGVFAEFDPKILGIAMALDAARKTDPDAAAVWNDRMNSRRAFAHQVAARLAKEGALADGWTVSDAADLIWAVFSPQTRVLLVERGWSPKRYAANMKRMIMAALTQA